VSHAYNKAKKQRRRSRPKRGHRLGKGEHQRRPSFVENEKLKDDLAQAKQDADDNYEQGIKFGRRAEASRVEGLE
jgi:hypothetical protein